MSTYFCSTSYCRNGIFISTEGGTTPLVVIRGASFSEPKAFHCIGSTFFFRIPNLNPIEALERVATFDVDVTAPDLLSGMGGRGFGRRPCQGGKIKVWQGLKVLGYTARPFPQVPRYQLRRVRRAVLSASRAEGARRVSYNVLVSHEVFRVTRPKLGECGKVGSRQELFTGVDVRALRTGLSGKPRSTELTHSVWRVEMASS